MNRQEQVDALTAASLAATVWPVSLGQVIDQLHEHGLEITERAPVEDEGTSTILVAFEVVGDWEEASRHLETMLPPAHFDGINEWWFAEDERYDGSDNEAAVFIPHSLTQVQAHSLLRFRPPVEGAS